MVTPLDARPQHASPSEFLAIRPQDRLQKARAGFREPDMEKDPHCHEAAAPYRRPSLKSKAWPLHPDKAVQSPSSVQAAARDDVLRFLASEPEDAEDPA